MEKEIRVLDTEKNLLAISHAHFIFRTNFAGDPSRDKFGSDRRVANVVVPDEMVDEMTRYGINVKTYNDNSGDDDISFVKININFKDYGNGTGYGPDVYLITGNSSKVKLEANNVKIIDDMRVDYVNLVCNIWENPNTGRKSLYLSKMYVYQKLDFDPWADSSNDMIETDDNNTETDFDKPF